MVLMPVTDSTCMALLFALVSIREVLLVSLVVAKSLLCLSFNWVFYSCLVFLSNHCFYRIL